MIGLDDYQELVSMRYSLSIEKTLIKKEYQFNGIQKALSSSLKLKSGYQDSSAKKQFKRELIIAPEYTVYLDLANISKDIVSKIKTYLLGHKAVYPLYMGINQFGADFENIEITQVEKVKEKETSIQTLVPLDDFIFNPKVVSKITNCRFATNINVKNRTFSEFKDFIVEISGKKEIYVNNNGNIYKINNQVVCFV